MASKRKHPAKEHYTRARKRRLASASHKVFYTPELAEAIFDYTACVDLPNIQRVCQTWNQVVLGSPRLQFKKRDMLVSCMIITRSERIQSQCRLLSITAATEQIAKDLCWNMTKRRFWKPTWWVPHGLGGIYMACVLMGEPVTPFDVTRGSAVKDKRMHAQYRLLYQRKDQIITRDMRRRGADPARLIAPRSIRPGCLEGVPKDKSLAESRHNLETMIASITPVDSSDR